MGDVKDVDVTGLIKKKSGNPLGDAHELFVRAIMMRLGFEVGKIDLSSSSYDVVVVGTDKPNGNKTFLRVQVKTMDNSLSLGGGSRGGIDRKYLSGVKTYKYTTEHGELIFGIDRTTLDIYVVPIRFCDLWGSSIAKSKIQILKNNWNILSNWNEEYLGRLYQQVKHASR